MAIEPTRTYRHTVSGQIGHYHPRVASADPHLIEVPEGTKPLAYTPIPQAAIDELESGHEPAEWAGPAGDVDFPKDEDPEALDAEDEE